jgi:hypothetical protein
MSDDDRQDEAAPPAQDPPAPAAAGAPPSLVPRITESGLHASLDALRPTVQPRADREPSPQPPRKSPPIRAPSPAALDVPARHDSDSAPLPLSVELPAWREPPADPGAHAAYRAIAQRTPPELRRPGLAIGAPDVRARAGLLEHLAQRGTGPARARLLVASAECWQRAGEPVHARALYEQAYVEDAGDPVLLRELRKYALAEHDGARAAQLLEREIELPIGAEERALALSLLAEIELVERKDRAAAERAAARAFAAHPSLGGALQLYTLHVGGGRDREAAEALRNAAARWPDPRAQSALLLLAARLLFRGGEPVAAQVLCRLSHDADPLALDALLCWTRAARESSDVAGAGAALERLASSLAGGELAEHALRARARLLDAAGDGAGALRQLAKARTLPGLRLRARLAGLVADRGERRAALEAWAEIAGGSERALALLGLAELELAEGHIEAAGRAIDQATAADGSSALARTMQAALARSRGGAAASTGTTDRDDESRLEAAARIAIDETATAQERALLAQLDVQGPTAAALALDIAAERGDLRAVRDALAHEARQLSGDQRGALELIRSELAAFAPDETPNEGDGAAARVPSTLLGWLQQTHAAADRAAAGAAWLELSALASGPSAATAATLAGDCMAGGGRAREAYERALAAEPGHAPACWALEPILLERDDAPALQRLHTALARSTRDSLERAARLRRAAALAGAGAGQDRKEAWHELAAGSPIDALLCDRELRVAGEGAPLALADALEGAGHGAGDALADLAALRAAASYEQCGEPARAAVLYRAIRDRKGSGGGHAEVGLERTLAAAGLSGLLIEQLERARADAKDPRSRLAAAERLALQQVASGDERRAAPVFRELVELDPLHVGALRAQQKHAMREGDHALLAACARSLAQRTRDPRERAAQLRLRARAQALRGDRPATIDIEPDAELGLWQAIELERDARRRGDAQAIAQAVARLCGHLRVANERASYAMRGAEALEGTSPAQAIEALEAHAFAAPNHPFAHEQLARLRHAAGDIEQAAADYEHAASIARVPQRSARLFYRAALLWQDVAGDGARARADLERVVAIDPLYRDAFHRLQRLLAGREHAAALAALYETRIAAGGDPAALADLHLEHSRVLARAGDEPGARAALADALALDPHRADALRAAADLDVAAGRFAGAAETLIQLARVTRDPELLRACFLELGRIYTEHVADPRRAEIAYARAVALDPHDTRALERLMQVLRDKREHERALRTCERLIELARDDAEIDRRTVELAAILEDMGEARRAERSLNARRERRPGAPAILTALADLYARQQDQAALAVHLDRSIHALRAALVDQPEEAASWTALCELLRRRGRAETAASVARLARDLGVAEGQVEQLAAPGQGIGAAAIESESLARLWPQQGIEPQVALLRWLETAADELLPDGPMQRIDRPDAALQSAVAAARAALGLPEPTLLGAKGSACVPVRAKPLTIAVGERLLDACDRDELAFALMRAAAVARLGLSAAARCDPAELDALLAAARSLDLPRDDAPDEEPLVAQMRERLEQRLAPKLRADLQTLARRVSADGFALQALALDAGARVALAASSRIAPALCAIAACGGEQQAAGYEQHDPLLALENEGARALLRFALSETYLELQARARDASQPGAHG